MHSKRGVSPGHRLRAGGIVADAPLVLMMKKWRRTISRNSLPTPKRTTARCTFARRRRHLVAHRLRDAEPDIGIDVAHVPYRGGGPAFQADLVAGRIDYLCNNVSTARQAVKSKQVKALAALTRERTANLPTAHEQGLTDFDAIPGTRRLIPRARRRSRSTSSMRSSKGDGDAGVSERLAKLIVPIPERRTPAYSASSSPARSTNGRFRIKAGAARRIDARISSSRSGRRCVPGRSAARSVAYCRPGIAISTAFGAKISGSALQHFVPQCVRDTQSRSRPPLTRQQYRSNSNRSIDLSKLNT